MDKEFIPYEQALTLIELGFDRNCFGWYDNERSPISVGESWRRGKNSIVAPTFSQVFRFFRDEYKLSGEPQSHQFWFSYNIIYDTLGENICKSVSYGFESYEDAELECLKKLIGIAKINKKS